MSSADAARNAMWAEVSAGSASAGSSGDARGKTVLARGCDPVMAERSESFLPPMLGGATVVATSNDDAFFAALRSDRVFDCVFFAPGACRWSAARRPIPGGNAATHGWGLDQYKAFVAEVRPGVVVVESAEESEMIPLLRKALGLPVDAK